MKTFAITILAAVVSAQSATDDEFNKACGICKAVAGEEKCKDACDYDKWLELKEKAAANANLVEENANLVEENTNKVDESMDVSNVSGSEFESGPELNTNSESSNSESNTGKSPQGGSGTKYTKVDDGTLSNPRQTSPEPESVYIQKGDTLYVPPVLTPEAFNSASYMTTAMLAGAIAASSLAF